MRVTASGLLTLASVAVIGGSFVSAWMTDDFWETIPMVPCVFGAGLFAALALYVRQRRLFEATALGIAAALVTFVGTLFITAGRWSS